MSRQSIERLPKELLELATLQGNEYAWPLDAIPNVIEAAKKINLLNIGGQLQLRIPGIGTCELYYIEVDTYKSVSESLNWSERVRQAAETAFRDYKALPEKWDFYKEARRGFDTHIDKFTSQGGDINQTMCFVWYVKSEQDEKERIARARNSS